MAYVPAFWQEQLLSSMLFGKMQYRLVWKLFYFKDICSSIEHRYQFKAVQRCQLWDTNLRENEVSNIIIVEPGFPETVDHSYLQVLQLHSWKGRGFNFWDKIRTKI